MKSRTQSFFEGYTKRFLVGRAAQMPQLLLPYWQFRGQVVIFLILLICGPSEVTI